MEIRPGDNWTALLDRAKRSGCFTKLEMFTLPYYTIEERLNVIKNDDSETEVVVTAGPDYVINTSTVPEQVHSKEFSHLVGQMEKWWQETGAHEVELTVPKSIEYGSIDTVEIGYDLLTTFSGSNRSEFTSQQAFETGCYFFIKGKMARWTSALRRNEPVSDDTLFDIGIYIKMVQRSRAVGGWPFEGSFERTDRHPDGIKNVRPGGGVRA